MAALAEIFASGGAILSGSDVPDHFYTDEILKAIGLKPFESFDASHVGDDVRLVIYSAAYDPAVNPELLEARRRGIPMFSYPQALGQLSRRYDASGIAGVHGKTTTTAMTGSILEAVHSPATVIAGSAVASFGNRCTYIGGDTFLVAETCEYKRHFLNFSPRRILLTSVESDHQDYYPTYESIRAAFIDYAESLPAGGRLIYCADDPGATQVADEVRSKRSDIVFVPYGFTAKGPYHIHSLRTGEGKSLFGIDAAGSGSEDQVFTLHVPGVHLVLDAAGAIALASIIMLDERGGAGGGKTGLAKADWSVIAAALEGFRGSKRRSEIVGTAAGVLVMDDYAHHPTAIRDTIAGLRSFWPNRRLVVDFMSHTYTRTKALLDEFSASFGQADCLILHGIYASAREKPIEGVTGRAIFEKAKTLNPGMVNITPQTSATAKAGAKAPATGPSGAPSAAPMSGPPENPDRFMLYLESIDGAADAIFPLLRAGDLFITMGAGDNWKVGAALLARLESQGLPSGQDGIPGNKDGSRSAADRAASYTPQSVAHGAVRETPDAGTGVKE